MRSSLFPRVSVPGFLALCLAVIAGAGSSPLKAANGSWLSGQTGTLNWADAANWTGGVVPGAITGTANADTATFGVNTGATLITIDAGRNIRTLTFNGTNASGLYTLGSAGLNTGPVLNLSSGGNLTMSLNTVTALTIHAPLVMQPASATTNGTYSILNNSTSVANNSADDNTYKINILGDISGGTTTGSITLSLGGTAGNRSNNASANVISGLITNGGAALGLGITVNGAVSGGQGAWTLTNPANSYTGATKVEGGTLIFSTLLDAGVNSAIGAGSEINLGSNGQFKYTGGDTSTNRSIINNGGVFYASGSGDITLTGSVVLNGTLTFRGGSDFNVDTVVTGTGGLSRTDNGVVNLNRVNTFSGDVSIASGAFRVASIADAGVDSPLGRGTNIRLGQNSSTVGRLEFTGTAGGSSNRPIVLVNGDGSSAGNGRISNTVAGQTLTLSGTVRANSGTTTHLSKLNLTGVGDGVMSGVIGGTVAVSTASVNMSLVKDGTGTWALSNANTYYGSTTISAGTLLALNTSGSATGTGNVITSGTGALGGTGFVTAAAGGSINIASGTRLQVGTTHGSIAGTAGPVGTTSVAGQLTLGSAANVAITLGGTLQFDLFGLSNGGTPGVSDRLLLQTTAPTVVLGGSVSIADSTGYRGLWQANQWQLVDWSGIGSATKTNTLTLNLPTVTLASGYAWNTADFLTTGKVSIEKVAANHTWTGTADTSWSNVANWEAGTVPTATTDVFFTNATQNLSHSIDGDKTVRNFFFSGESNNTINRGSGGVLYSNGSLIEVLGGTQRFTAQLRPRNGFLTQFDIINHGTLEFTSTIMYHRNSTGADMTFAFSGSGNTSLPYILRRYDTYNASIIVNGPGTVTFSSGTTVAASTTDGFITGPTTINGGTLRLNAEFNIGGNPADFNPAHLTLNGGTLSAYATFTMDDSNRGITIAAGGGNIGAEGTHTLTLATPFTGTGSWTKTGTGNLILSGASTHSGATTVSTGVLQVGLAGQGSSGTGATTVASGAHLVGTGVVQAASFNLQSGAVLQAGDLTTGTTTGNGVLTFTPTSIGTYTLQADSKMLLSLTSATNQSALGSPFDGFAPGTPGYNSYIDGLTGIGSGSHDLLVFNGAAGSTLEFSGDLQVTGGSFTPSFGQVYNLLDWAELVAVDFSNFDVGVNRDGSGDDLSQFNLPDISSYGLFWDVSRFTFSGTIAVIPEPTRPLLMMLGLSLALLRRRRIA